MLYNNHANLFRHHEKQNHLLVESVKHCYWYKSSVGWYRDDGLTSMNYANGTKLDIIRQYIIALFREEGLQSPWKQTFTKEIF